MSMKRSPLLLMVYLHVFINLQLMLYWIVSLTDISESYNIIKCLNITLIER